VTKKTSPKKKKEVAAEEDPGSPELAEIAEEGDDQDAAEAAAAAALLAEVMRPLRMTHPPPEDADYLKTNPAPQTQRKAPQTAPSALSKVGLLSTPGMAEPESVSYLIANYAKLAPDVELVGFVNGYQGLLLGQTIAITPDMRDKASKGALLTLIKSADCRDPLLVASLSAAIESPSLAVTHGVCKEGDKPMRVAAEQVKALGLQVLHVIGGYETVNAAVELAAFLASDGYELCVIALPKTVDNDIAPITQTPGAWSATEDGAQTFTNEVANMSADQPKALVVREMAGRDCGWLTASTARRCHDTAALLREEFAKGTPPEGLTRLTTAERFEVHAVYVPEMSMEAIDIGKEAARLKAVLAEHSVVNVFIADGLGIKELASQTMPATEGEPPPSFRDAIGRVDPSIKLGRRSPAERFVEALSKQVGAEETHYFRSADYTRAMECNDADRRLVAATATLAVQKALQRQAGLVGLDEDAIDPWRLRLIELERLKPAKPFDRGLGWFVEMMEQIGQAPIPIE